jgi:hypothetical protein
MFLNLITPCTRPKNLFTIAESIRDTIPRECYRWIVVFDAASIPNCPLPANAEYHAVHVPGSISGNGQRNYALDLVEHGHVYFQDDDTAVHPDLWSNINHLNNVDFISFKQAHKSGALRLDGRDIRVGSIDSHNFVSAYSAIGRKRWILGDYCADGHFAHDVYNASKTVVYIDRVLSVYNVLRNE